MKTKLSIRKRAPQRGLPGDLSHARGGGARLAVMAVASAAFVLMLLSSTSAQLQVRDLVEIEGAGPNYLRGVGLVVGLNGTGDGDKGETLTMLKNIVANDLRRPVGEMSSKNVALVTVTAVLPPFAKPGTAIDVRVQASNGAKSLAGGTLFITPLRSPRATGEDPTVFAVAQGPVIVEGDARAGNPNAGVVKRGGLIETGIRQEIVSRQIWEMTTPVRDTNGGIVGRLPTETRRMPTIILNLKKPDIETAMAIAEGINSRFRMVTDLNFLPVDYLLKNPLARVIDGGRVWVRLPGGQELKDVGRESVDPRYEWEPAKFVAAILPATVPPRRPRAVVIINDANKSIAVVGDVKVKPGYVGFDGGQVNIAGPASIELSALLDGQINNAALTPQKRIDLIRALDRAGMIEGIVEGS